jgi:PAS domain S-box-containing protein
MIKSKNPAWNIVNLFSPKQFRQQPQVQRVDKHEDFFHSVMDNLLEGCQVLGYDWRYIYLNKSAEVQNHRSNQELLGNRYMDMWPGIESTQVFSEIRRCMEDRVVVQLENRFVYPGGEVGWFNLSIQPMPEGILILSFDITARVLAEKHLAQMKRLYATLSQVNQIIVRTNDREKLYKSICDVAVQFGEFSLAWIGLLDEKTGVVNPIAANGLDIGKWPFPKVNINRGAFMDSLTSLAIRNSRVVTSEDLQKDEMAPYIMDQIRKYPYHSAASVPFRVREKTIGVLTLISGDMGFFKSQDEVSLLEEMGLDISFALDQIMIAGERKLAEQSLKESEALFSAIFNSSPYPISLTDLSTEKWVMVNDAFLHITGYKREEVISHTYHDIQLWKHPEDREIMTNLILEHGHLSNFKVDINRKDSTPGTMLISVENVVLADKHYFLIIGNDVTGSFQPSSLQ